MPGGFPLQDTGPGMSQMFGDLAADEAEAKLAKLEAIADAIDAARYAHPQNPRPRPRPFADADPSDREYAIRLARAAMAAAL